MATLATLFVLLLFTFISIGAPAGAALSAPRQVQIVAPSTQRYQGYREPRFKGVNCTGHYVTMRDGVKIAVDLYLPKDLPADEKIPTLLNFTRYWRATAGSQPGDLQRFIGIHGYALVFVDVRGTGASFGTWAAPFSRDEVTDAGEIVNWIVAQPWSDGKVGAFGSSYGGNSAQLLAVPNHPAVKAVIPRQFDFDLYNDAAFPGGIFNEWMVKNWNAANHQLDNNVGARPVDADTDASLARAAVKAHENNIDVYSAAQKVSYRDDRPFAGLCLDDLSLHNYHKDIERSKVAINGWGSWLDAATANGVIHSFVNLSNRQRAIIGAWNHNNNQNASPFVTTESPLVMQRFEMLRFFDQYLKGIDTGLDVENELNYYTMGEERWKSTRVWPVEGSKSVRWYLAEANALTTSAPVAATGSDAYKIDFDATTGEKNRWRTQLGGPVIYPDRAEEERRLLTYTSAPLAEDIEITGHPIVNLYVTSTHTDGAFFVYLEDVDEKGRVSYITEGQLRALHRKVSAETPPYRTLAPYHSFKKSDSAPLVPGEVAELRFALHPTSVLIKKGHRIRIAIAGHDKSVFARIPAEGTPVITVARNSVKASFVELPQVDRRVPLARANLMTFVPPQK